MVGTDRPFRDEFSERLRFSSRCGRVRPWGEYQPEAKVAQPSMPKFLYASSA